MKRFDVLQTLWLLLLLGGVAYAARAADSLRVRPTTSQHPTPARGPTAQSQRDATGREVRLKHYLRIASTSSYADQLLLALCEPERIAALSRTGHSSARDAFRYGSRPLISGPGDLETLLMLHVDLLLITELGTQPELARVRGAGIEVVDLGQTRGVGSLERSIRLVAALLGDPGRGERLWHRWSQQLRAVARDIPNAQRKPAAYVAIYVNKLYGGTRGTSYHDVLQAAGLRDVAAEHFSDWPQYDPEQLLAMDPPLIVTEAGMGQQICSHAWLGSLRACAPGKASRYAGIVEMSGNLMGSAGLGMLDAALSLHERVYPSR